MLIDFRRKHPLAVVSIWRKLNPALVVEVLEVGHLDPELIVGVTLVDQPQLEAEGLSGADLHVRLLTADGELIVLGDVDDGGNGLHR